MSSASANSPRARRYAASMAPSVDIVGENAASPRAGTRYREGAAAVTGRSATKRASTRLLSENDDGFVVASHVARAAPAAAPTRDEGSCVPNPTRVGVDAADRSRSRDDGRADAARSADAVRPAVVPAVDCRVPRWVVASRVEPIEPSSRSDRETGVAAENVRAPAKSPRRAGSRARRTSSPTPPGPRPAARARAVPRRGDRVEAELELTLREVRRSGGDSAHAHSRVRARCRGPRARPRWAAGTSGGRPWTPARSSRGAASRTTSAPDALPIECRRRHFGMRRRSRTFLRWHTCVSKQS